MKLKYTFLNLISACTAGLLLPSCQKDFSTETGFIADSTTTPATTDSIYLSRFIYIDTESGVIDSNARGTYLYDNLKRVAMINDTSHEASTGEPDNIGDTKFFYNSNEITPYKMVSHNTITGGFHPLSDTTVHFYSFNAAAQITKDSALHAQHGIDVMTGMPSYENWLSVKSYTYAGGKIYDIETVTVLQSSTSSQSYYTTNTGIPDGAGNIIIDSLKQYDNAGALQLDRAILYTYDNHPSPLSKLNIARVYPFPDDESLLDVGYTPYNNILLIHTFINDPGIPASDDYEDFNGLFTYKPDGLPAQVSLPFITAPDSGKILFFYKAL